MPQDNFSRSGKPEIDKASLPEVSPFHGIFAQARLEPETITLFQGWTRFTTDHHGEMHAKPLEGLFCAETRLMTGYEIRLKGKPISHRFSVPLSSNEWTSTGAILKSGDSGNLPSGTLPKGAIEVRILRKCGQGISEQIFIKNNGIPTRQIHFELGISCPILDSEFSEETKKLQKNLLQGICPRLSKSEGSLLLHYERTFGKRRRTPTEELSIAYGARAPRDGDLVTRGIDIRIFPRKGHPRTKIRIEGSRRTRIHAWAELGPRQELCLQIDYEPIINGIRMGAPKLDGLLPLPRKRSDSLDGSLKIVSSNSTFNLMIGQAQTDFRSLRLPLFEDIRSEDLTKRRMEKPNINPDLYTGFIAGVPRYIGLFGRDTVISGWQGILFEPDFLEPALSRLALFQGTKYDDWRDEEPNRILHERRLDPLSQIGKLNRNLYYGDVTSTPFWIRALASLYHWTGDRELIQRHQSTLESCCRWVLRRLREGDGFIYYNPSKPSIQGENRNQAWKDSGDAIVDENGRIRTPPLALAEIQGYAYQALNEAAVLLSHVDSHLNINRLRSEAKSLKLRFNHSFWLPEDSFYALALDAVGTPLRSRASNIGHCLGTGILDSSKIDAVVKGLTGDDMFSGWGIRTLSSNNPAFDPFSYHRGSVWPVENAIIAEGMAILGYREESNRIISGQLSLAALFPQMRLPEVFGDEPRSREFQCQACIILQISFKLGQYQQSRSLYSLC